MVSTQKDLYDTEVMKAQQDQKEESSKDNARQGEDGEEEEEEGAGSAGSAGPRAGVLQISSWDGAGWPCPSGYGPIHSKMITGLPPKNQGTRGMGGEEKVAGGQGQPTPDGFESRDDVESLSGKALWDAVTEMYVSSESSALRDSYRRAREDRGTVCYCGVVLRRLLCLDFLVSRALLLSFALSFIHSFINSFIH